MQLKYCQKLHCLIRFTSSFYRFTSVLQSALALCGSDFAGALHASAAGGRHRSSAHFSADFAGAAAYNVYTEMQIVATPPESNPFLLILEVPPVQWTVRGYLAVRPTSVRPKPSKLTQSWGHANDLHSQFGIAEIVVSSRWKGPMFNPFPSCQGEVFIYFELMTTCCSMIHGHYGHCPSMSFHADSK